VAFNRSEVATPYGACSLSFKISFSVEFSDFCVLAKSSKVSLSGLAGTFRSFCHSSVRDIPLRG
jgi:hypothetical protein